MTNRPQSSSAETQQRLANLYIVTAAAAVVVAAVLARVSNVMSDFGVVIIAVVAFASFYAGMKVALIGTAPRPAMTEEEMIGYLIAHAVHRRVTQMSRDRLDERVERAVRSVLELQETEP